MNYIYDIVLNFSKDNLYEFYEWKDEDYPEFILKMPAFKVDEETFIDMKYNDINVSKEFISKLFDKTEVYNSNSIKLIKYACLFVGNNEAVAVEFDENGNNYMKSLLCIDEENDVLDIVRDFKYTIVDYKVKNKIKFKTNFNTRFEQDLKLKIEKEINNMYLNKDYNKLKYIFYELFYEKEEDEVSVYYKLINIIKQNDQKIYKIKELLSIMDKKIMNQS